MMGGTAPAEEKLEAAAEADIKEEVVPVESKSE